MNGIKRALTATMVLGGIALASPVHALTVTVVDQDGNAVSGFKWLLEQDNTHLPRVGEHPAPAADVTQNPLSTSIHKSHAPVVARGESANSNQVVIDEIGYPEGIGYASGFCPGGSNCVALPSGRYFLSVLPFGDGQACDQTFDMGGTSIDTSTQSAVTVEVRRAPIETAQISVKVFHDILPLNNAPDVAEVALDSMGNPVLPMAGFTVTLGDQGGDILTDAFGNKLGTTYQRDLEGNYVLGGDCAPIVVTVGSGDFETPPNGEVIIKNLTPGKYAVQVEPPAGDEGWEQVTTIEGTKTIDTWVRPNEPPFLVEFGPPFWHTFYGFTKEFNNLGAGNTTVIGTVRKAHLSRPPAIVNTPGPVPEGEAVGERCIVGLNTLELGQAGEAVYVGKCDDATGEFSIPNVPPGTYQLVVFDVSLLKIITFNTVITDDMGGTLDLGDVLTPEWFGVHEHNVYSDDNRNARRDPGEVGIPEQNVNLRYRDGTIYQAFPTDTEGFVPFQEVFPLFHWYVAEVDFARNQATGLRVVVDDGGPVTNDQWGEGKRNPQLQPDQNGQPFRVERGPVLLEAFQQFAGQNTRFEWGKSLYDGDINAVDNSSEAAFFASTLGWPNGAGDVDTCLPGALVPRNCDANNPVPGQDNRYNANGGISGTVTYATTRAEDDPRFAAVEPWEPGVPRVQVNLYRDVWCASNGFPAVFPLCPEANPGQVGDGVPDDKNGNGNVNLADVDNYPLGWAPANCPTGGQTCSPGPEDVDHNGNGNFNLGDAIRVTWTDSWDDSLPEGCVGNNVEPIMVHGGSVPIEQCAEGLRTWNQVRPGVFDGGFAFGPGDPLVIPGTYIVEAVTPPGYRVVAEEDRNVDFGPTPIPAILPPLCVGDDHTVPQYMSFITNEAGQPLAGFNPADFPAPFAGETRRLCDRKQVDLGNGQNAAVEFHLFTPVPKAARAVGLMTDDFANELAPGKPAFTEKYSPPWFSIAVFDYTGHEILRTYGDEFGAYNFMAASTYAINVPSPSGVGPKMHHFCLNHPGPIPDGNGGFITDPQFKPQYSTTCYSFNFEAGRTTYLDTPVIRQAAFVGALQTTLDCELEDGTPLIESVIGDVGPATVNGHLSEFTITSVGTVMVPNPAYPGGTLGMPDDPPTEPEFIPRDYGFGATKGRVCVGDDFCFPNGRVTWTNDAITVQVRQNHYMNLGLATGQLEVRKHVSEGGQRSPYAVTLNVMATEPPSVTPINVFPGAGTPIQDAIDGAGANDLILINPGEYRELPILYKRVRLQGAGAWSTRLVASHFSTGPNFDNALVAWREKLAELVGTGELGVLPEQDPGMPDFFLKDGEGPGILVSPNGGGVGGNIGNFSVGVPARIDGLQIMAADLGGAIYVNTNAERLRISNMRLIQNAGNLGGGIRVGNPTVVAFARGGVAVDTSPNRAVRIHNNHILENGSATVGGGIALFDGADGYNISHNNMCGNFARSGGGAIAHQGLNTDSMDGPFANVIENNRIVFNEAFQGDQPGTGFGIGGGGGGIAIAGDPDPNGLLLTEGTGNVVIDANLIQGNLGGAADGGGIALNAVNGQDAGGTPWFVAVFNNMIVNNVTGQGGAGISMQDAVDVRIRYNTIAHNDSTATSVGAGIGTPPTLPLPAGILSRAHSADLQAVVASTFSDPALAYNILWHNRSFYYDDLATPVLQPTAFGPADYWDLGVVGDGDTGTFSCLNPVRSSLSAGFSSADPELCSYASNNQFLTDPLFVSPYFNDLTTAAAADEGGNFVQVYFTPLGLTGDYHLNAGSPAIDAWTNGANGRLSTDFDEEDRPSASGLVDIGADEVQP